MTCQLMPCISDALHELQIAAHGVRRRKVVGIRIAQPTDVRCEVELTRIVRSCRANAADQLRSLESSSRWGEPIRPE